MVSFCSYHGTIANVPGYGEVYYTVMPDFTPAAGGCGTDPVEFHDATSVLSHELVETITDPEVGLATGNAPPLAWYDNNNGEIGDICNAQQGTVTGSDGVNYVVQTEYSNALVNCVVNNSSVMTAPAITSGSSVSIAAGSAGSFAVTSTGSPPPVLTGSGALPSGVTFVDNGNGTAALAGTPASGTAGTYALTLTAHNGVGSDATQAFTLTVSQAPAITSASSASLTVGAAGSFTVTTTGLPKPTLTASGTLPSGVTFVDNGNGTAALGGTPASGTAGTYALTLTARNGVGSDAMQAFTLTVNSPPGLLRVVSSPAVPSQISVDGVASDTWGLTWLEIAPGSHEVCFSAVQGFGTPGCQSVSVTSGVTTAVTGTFVEHGFLKVVTSPAVPSRVSVDGVPADDWGVFTDVPVGTHQVCFGAVAGYTPPACQSVSVTAGAQTDVTGVFTASPGASGLSGVGLLRVTTSAGGAQSDQCGWGGGGYVGVDLVGDRPGVASGVFLRCAGVLHAGVPDGECGHRGDHDGDRQFHRAGVPAGLDQPGGAGDGVGGWGAAG